MDCIWMCFALVCHFVQCYLLWSFPTNLLNEKNICQSRVFLNSVLTLAWLFYLFIQKERKKRPRAGQASKTFIFSAAIGRWESHSAAQGQKEASLSVTLPDRMESDTRIRTAFCSVPLPTTGSWARRRRSGLLAAGLPHDLRGQTE